MQHLDTEKLQQKYRDYLKFKESEDYDEEYKFDFFQNNTIDLSKTENFVEDFKTLRKNAQNLIPHSIKNNLFINLGTEFEDEIIFSFKKLYDESIDIDQRIQIFEKEILDYSKKSSILKNKDFGKLGFGTTSFLLAIKYPNKYFPLNPVGCFNNFIKAFHFDPKLYKKGENGVRYKHWLHLVKNDIFPELQKINKHISLLDVQDFIYCEFGGYAENNPLKNYWLYSPGEDAQKWEQEKTKNYISIAWEKLGDLSKYKTKKEIQEAYRKYYGENATNNILANYEFSKKISVGDIIFVKQKLKTILGYGKVVKTYYFDDNEKTHKSKIGVKWETLEEFELEDISDIDMKQLPLKTLTNMSPYPDFVQYLLHKFSKNFPKNIMKKTSCETDLLDTKKQIILYGPPGTGKTYNVKTIIQNHSGENYKDLQNEGRVEFITFHQSFSYEEFIEGIKPDLDSNSEEISYKIEDGIFKKIVKKAKKRNSTHYLVIDEINRGNISKIFGELITLLEADKRLGESNEITTRLPYSKEEFGIPSNLFIVATMNTSDKSIVSLDTALRRRFGFVEKLPDYTLEGLQKHIEGIHLGTLLQKINDRIEYFLDKDHLIGHSYFLKVNNISELKLAIFHEIFPLLEEYFYGEEEKIQQVLGSQFFTEKTFDTHLFEKNMHQEDDEKQYIFNKNISDDDFIRAVKNIISTYETA
ncbi:AAA family ATPase [Candidatus Gracilibacteria bacterium]|nr:AAA family ATPase [Candidatus Gracilibacteria bacterium]